MEASTRATWLKMTALMLAVPLLAGCVNTAAPQDLTAAAVNDAPPTGTVREFHIYVSEAVRHTPIEGKVITGFGFSLDPEGPFTTPGPEIRVRQGDTIRAWLHSVGIGHTVHWHGLKLPWAMDGVPFMTQTIVSGNSTYLYEFVARESGTYWYHCHVEAPSHVDYGLFGPLIIEPADPTVDPPFDREYTMMLSELDSTLFASTAVLFGDPSNIGNTPRNPFDAADASASGARTTYDILALGATGTTEQDGAALGASGPRDYYPAGSIRYRPKYDTFMVNMKSFPETEPLYITSGETIRIRMTNAGQLVHSMHLHGTHFLVTHKDGYKLPAPYYADTLLIGPAERYDIYVEGDNPGMWDFHDHGGAWNVGGYASNDYAFPGGMATMLVYEDFTYAKLPEPEPGKVRTSGDYRAFAPSYAGVSAPPSRLLHQH